MPTCIGRPPPAPCTQPSTLCNFFTRCSQKNELFFCKVSRESGAIHGFQRLFHRVVEWAEFVEGCAPLVRRLSGFGRSDPFSNGVSRQTGTLGYLVQRELVAEVHPPDFSQHFHADHPVFSCSKSEQKQLNTWASLRSAATDRAQLCIYVA